jgi:hypothetical protein
MKMLIKKCLLNKRDTSSMPKQSKCGDLDSLKLWVEVIISEPMSLQGVLFHLLIVKSANCVEVRASSKLLQLLLGVVQLEDLLDTVVVLSHVVPVLVHSQCLVNLPLHLRYFIFI